ncbi:MAG: GerAB/ArcD/ProY family transporter [Syntrophomonadaceae bacterium]|jgi:spore germination protein KB
MNQEVISNRQGISILVIFMVGSTIILNPGKEAGVDSWIAILLAVLVALPMLLIHTRLMRIFPGKDLFDLQQKAFGKIAGKITSFFFVWFTFHLGTLVLRNFSEFIQLVSLQETPQFPILISMGFLCIWAAKSGIEALGRFAICIIPLVVCAIIVVFLLSIPQMDLKNIRPVLYNGIGPVLNSTASLFAFPFGELALFTMVFDSLKSKDKIFQAYIIGTIMTASILILSYVRNILVIGGESYSSHFFPSYFSISVISIGDFLQRIEAVVGVIFLFGGFIKASVCLYIASKGCAKIFNLGNYSDIAAPIGLLMVCMAGFIYTNTMEMFEWAAEIYKYYVIPFYVILPLITLIVIEIKTRGNSPVPE